jgi:hypothetical protein
MLQQQPEACCPNQTYFKQQVSHVPIHLGLWWVHGRLYVLAWNATRLSTFVLHVPPHCIAAIGIAVSN